MTLKNFTKIDIDDDLRTALLRRYRQVTEPAERCLHCHRFPSYHCGICRNCRDACRHENVITGYIIKTNGGRQVKRLCFDCGAGPATVGPATRGSKYLDLCLEDNRDDTVCEHCGSTDGVELHHYAPWNTFDDAHRWATGHLCRRCHHTWHATMDGYRWHTKRSDLPRLRATT